jgi:hypothetical protein
MVEVSVMSEGEAPADLLVEAIGQFRLELIEWIDSQLDSLGECEAWPLGGSVVAMAPAKGLAARPEPIDATVPVSELRMMSQKTATAEVAGSQVQHDSSHRLDAVARRLGERLRLSEESRKGSEISNRD